MSIATQCTVPQRSHSASGLERAARSIGTALLRWAESREARQPSHEHQQLRLRAETALREREHAARRLLYFS